MCVNIMVVCHLNRHIIYLISILHIATFSFIQVWSQLPKKNLAVVYEGDITLKY